VRLGIPARLEHAKHQVKRVSDPTYLHTLYGTLGVDPAVVGK
jgi:hypothetical protein